MFCSLGGIFSNDTSSQFSAEGVNIVSLEQSQNTSWKSEKKIVRFQLDKMKDHFKINFLFIKIKYFHFQSKISINTRDEMSKKIIHTF